MVSAALRRAAGGWGAKVSVTVHRLAGPPATSSRDIGPVQSSATAKSPSAVLARSKRLISSRDVGAPVLVTVN